MHFPTAFVVLFASLIAAPALGAPITTSDDSLLAKRVIGKIYTPPDGLPKAKGGAVGGNGAAAAGDAVRPAAVISGEPGVDSNNRFAAHLGDDLADYKARFKAMLAKAKQNPEEAMGSQFGANYENLAKDRGVAGQAAEAASGVRVSVEGSPARGAAGAAKDAVYNVHYAEPVTQHAKINVKVGGSPVPEVVPERLSFPYLYPLGDDLEHAGERGIQEEVQAARVASGNPTINKLKIAGAAAAAALVGGPLGYIADQKLQIGPGHSEASLGKWDTNTPVRPN